MVTISSIEDLKMAKESHEAYRREISETCGCRPKRCRPKNNKKIQAILFYLLAINYAMSARPFMRHAALIVTVLHITFGIYA